MSATSKMSNFLKGTGDFLFHGVYVDEAEMLQKRGLTNADIAKRMLRPEEEVAELLAEAAARIPKPIDIFVVWNINAESWSLGRTMISMHQTVKGALADIPESLKKDLTELNPEETGGKYIYDFNHFAIEKRSVEA